MMNPAAYPAGVELLRPGFASEPMFRAFLNELRRLRMTGTHQELVVSKARIGCAC